MGDHLALEALIAELLQPREGCGFDDGLSKRRHRSLAILRELVVFRSVLRGIGRCRSLGLIESDQPARALDGTTRASDRLGLHVGAARWPGGPRCSNRNLPSSL